MDRVVDVTATLPILTVANTNPKATTIIRIKIVVTWPATLRSLLKLFKEVKRFNV
ncbi:MAG: hypothetical protein V1863_01275 [Candidatus Omnitrophota bacterium]